MHSPAGRRGADSSNPPTANQRAISDVIGYVLIFALIVSAVTFVLISGMGSLEESRETERAANAERAFDVIHDNMAALYERNAPSRSTEVDLSDSEIYYGSNISIEVRGDGSRIAAYEARPVELQVTNEESLVYEGGAVIRDQADADIMLNEPPFLLTEHRVHVPIIQTTSEALESAGGSTILLRGQSADRSVIEGGSSYDEVTLSIASPRYNAWYDYLATRGALDCTRDDAAESVECSTDEPDSVFVTRQQIELSLIL